jgi:hypothetical protein
LGVSFPFGIQNNHRKEKGSTMSFFGKILDKLGFNGSEAQAAPAPQAPSAPESPAPQAAPASPASPKGTTVVDVKGKLEGLAASNSQKLNWKTSIVDLLKLLGLDSSLAARKELATELGCPQDKMNDSAQMNMWLHKTVLQKLAENGGNIPKELLDQGDG